MKRPPFLFVEDEVDPGSRLATEIPVGRLPSGSYLSLPVEVVHGAQDGPTIWLSGAIHGDEIVGVEIIRQVMDHLEPDALSGTVIATPVVNVFGFVSESRYLPDRRDLNRSFPGSRSGSLASRLARLFMEEVVARCSFGIDFHAGSDDRTNLPQIRGNMDDAETRRLAIAFGPQLIIHSRPQKGTLRHAVLRKEKRVLLFEGGEPRRFSPQAVSEGVAGTLRTLKALDMLEGSPETVGPPPQETRSTYWVRASRGGIFHLEVGLGQRVGKGTRLGTISDPIGGKASPLKTSKGGVVLGHTVNPLVNLGDAVVHLAEV